MAKSSPSAWKVNEPRSAWLCSLRENGPATKEKSDQSPAGPSHDPVRKLARLCPAKKRDGGSDSGGAGASGGGPLKASFTHSASREAAMSVHRSECCNSQ